VLLLDNSAWLRRRHPLVRERLAEALQARELAVCLPFLLGAGYSAVSKDDLDGIVADLAELPRIQVSSNVEVYALMAQRELAKVGHHRLPPANLIIAACAHTAGAGILHYDRDYDVIAKRTTLEFKSEWLAPPGTL
jgi:predicted nucleic acid-binding protein